MLQREDRDTRSAVREFITRDDELTKLYRSTGQSQYVEEFKAQLSQMKRDLDNLPAGEPANLPRTLDELSRQLRDGYLFGDEDRTAFRRMVLKAKQTLAETGAANATDELRNTLEMCIRWTGENTLKRRQLDKFLGALLNAKHSYEYMLADIDHRFGEDSRRELSAASRSVVEATTIQCREYLGCPWMHTSVLTNFLLTGLIDPCFRRVEWESQSHHFPSRFTSTWPLPWGVLVPAGMSFTFFAATTALIALFFRLGLPWLAWPCIALLMWHYGWRFRENHLADKTRTKAAHMAEALNAIRAEVISGRYDAPTVANRLRQLEKHGLLVHSLAYRLLRMPPVALGDECPQEQNHVP